jgi:hypothetical protein
MIYRLIGLLNPSFSETSFLIPYFSREDTNITYVQSLDDTYCIQDFCPYDIDRFVGHRSHLPTRGIHRTTGKPGVLGFAFSAEEFACGTPLELRSMLDQQFVRLSDVPFVQLEVARFLGRQTEATAAIKTASRLFVDNEIRQRWTEREEAARFPSSGPAPLSGEVLFGSHGNDVPGDTTNLPEELEDAAQLPEDFGDPRWAKLWL